MFGDLWLRIVREEEGSLMREETRISSGKRNERAKQSRTEKKLKN